MTKSTITRERLEEIILDNSASLEEFMAITRMALAAMDSEPVAYTDERNLGYIGRGRETAYLWGKQNSEASDVALYRHAQPAPVVPDEVTAEDCPALVKYDVTEVDEAWARGFNAYRAAMLQAEPVTTANKLREGIGAIRNSGTPIDDEKIQEERDSLNSPAIPDGYVMVPMRLTAENGAKGALSGEFSEAKFVNCTECFGDDECEICDGSGRIEITVPVTWTTIKDIWAKGVEHFAAVPQEASSESQ